MDIKNCLSLSNLRTCTGQAITPEHKQVIKVTFTTSQRQQKNETLEHSLSFHCWLSYSHMLSCACLYVRLFVSSSFCFHVASFLPWPCVHTLSCHSKTRTPNRNSEQYFSRCFVEHAHSYRSLHPSPRLRKMKRVKTLFKETMHCVQSASTDQ